ncbi:MAG: hypothetical protein NXH97_14795 [Rhodobacteraceae bacterium]|nr:hypothetical protein [Paracoccaceae bacterium]
MKPFRTVILTAVFASTALPVLGADYSDPTWPCVARKVESLSLGLMWPHPVPEADAITDEALRKDVADLAEALGLRRVELETLRPAVESFAEAHDGDPDALGLVFSRVFDSLSKRRSRIISGIGKFSLSQIALAEQIDSARLEMDTVLQASAPDFDRADVLEEQLDWDQLIYSDRQRSIQYLCETPQIIERRLFAIAQMLQQVAQK